MEKCRISVALASYNGGNYLKEQLESIYTQSLLPNEVIVCDDCSTDNSIEILNDYKGKYGLKYFINEKKLGFVKNFEKTIGLCSGEYIALSDQDDVWLPGKIETLYNSMITAELQHHDFPVLVHHDSFLVDDNLKNTQVRFIDRRGNVYGLKNLLFGNPKVQGASSMFNRKLIELCFPLPDQIPLHDLYMSYVCECYGFRKFISQPLMLYRQHNNNLIGVPSYPFRIRISRILKKQITLSDESEKKTLIIFGEKFKSYLSYRDKEIIEDYFKILSNEIGFGTKARLVLKNGFNSGGSKLKLLLKILFANE